MDRQVKVLLFVFWIVFLDALVNVDAVVAINVLLFLKPLISVLLLNLAAGLHGAQFDGPSVSESAKRSSEQVVVAVLELLLHQIEMIQVQSEAF